MTPEEFYWNNKLTNQEYMKEIRVRSLAQMLDCYQRGTIRRRTIKNLIPKASLEILLQEMEERERYEDCAVIKNVIDTIYQPLEIKINNMSIKKQKEIVSLLKSTISDEQKKISGGNKELIESLTRKLEQVKNWKEDKNAE